MQLYSILALAVFASAYPSSSTKQDSSHPQQVGRDGALMTAGQCQVGQHYCYSQIVDDLSTFLNHLLPSTPLTSIAAALVYSSSLTTSRSGQTRHPPPVLRPEVQERLAELQSMQETVGAASLLGRPGCLEKRLRVHGFGDV